MMKTQKKRTIRRLLPAALPLLLLVFAGCNKRSMKTAAANTAQQTPVMRTAKQGLGKIVYWVLPGPRRLDASVFGTPGNPKMGFKEKLQAAQQAVAAHKMPPSVPQLLKHLPFLVGVPVNARVADADGNWWFRHPTPFGDKARIIQGDFTATYWDVVKKDPPGPPGKTPDKARMLAHFTDPAGNTYKVVLDHVVKPPFPGYETAGGVMIDGYHHGNTGTGSPLMPKVRTYAAFWGIGDVYINGKLAEPHRVIHMMTTEIVRDRDYRLASDSEMPLPPNRWHIKGQPHHTHLVVLPITPTKQGPVFKPLKTAFRLPNGMPQPFIHVMYEQDEIS